MAAAQNNNKAAEAAKPPAKKFTFMVANDHMSAGIIVHQPEEGAAPVTKEEFDNAMRKNRVVYGLKQSAIEKIFTEPAYETMVCIAEGTPPEHGRPASIEYKVKTSVNARPAEREDGTVDYKDMGIVQNVRQGDLLAVKTPPTKGTPGRNVHDGPLKCKPGRDLPLPLGKNTVPSDDMLEVYAAIDGQVSVVNRKIQVLNTYTVDQNVNYATGNISFVGNVEVNGNVFTGFSIQASGDILVKGSVEGAQLTADGNIVIREGVNGFGKGLIKAGGDIKCKYIQSTTVQAAGEVETNFILHSTVQSGSVVRLVGGRAMVAGGHITALKRIEAVFAGGRGALINTILEVGSDPAILERYRAIPGEISKHEKDIARFDRAIALLREYERRNQLSEEKKEALQKAAEAHSLLSEQLRSLQAENASIQEDVASLGFGVISIRETAYPGVRIFIGPERLNLETKHERCIFTRDPSGIKLGPYR